MAADFDSNHTLDVALISDTNSLEVFPGYGDFTFAPPASYPTDASPQSVVSADFNRDGRLDLAVTARDGRAVDLFLNQGGVVFTISTMSLDRAALGIAAADLDRDGVADLAVSVATAQHPASSTIAGAPVIYEDGDVYILHGRGDGTFQHTASFPTNTGPVTVVAGDFNRDGSLDIATGNVSQQYDVLCDYLDGMSDSVAVLPGLGGGVFGAPATYPLVPQTATQFSDGSDQWYRGAHRGLSVADVNGDGQPDLVASPGAVLLNVAAAANHVPTASAGTDATVSADTFSLDGTAGGSDRDWLTFEWRDEATGTIVGTRPRQCLSRADWQGTRRTIALTVRDGRGGVATDSVSLDFGTAAALSPGWSSQDIGNVSAAGSSSFDGTTYTVTGSGADIWGTADEFRYAYTPVSGNFDVSTRVATVQNVSQWTKAGLMIRGDTSPDAPHVSLFATPTSTKGIALQWRLLRGSQSYSSTGPATAPPSWLRLVRQGDTITGYYRVSAVSDWTRITSVTIANLPADVLVGLAVTSHADGTLATATFDQLVVNALTEALPAGWVSRDIGAVGAAGSAAYANGTFTIAGSGSDIWGTNDEFHFVSLPHDLGAAPQFEITAEVTGVQNVNQWTKAGLMVRSSPDRADAAHASILVTPTTTKGMVFQRRTIQGNTSLSTAGPAITSPVWLKLIVWQNTVRAYYRTGTTGAWTFVGQTSITWSGSTVDAGLAVSSHVDGTLASATFANVSIRPLVSWSDQDIGSTALSGSTSDDSGTTLQPPLGTVFTVRGSGADIWGSADAFHYRHVGAGSSDIAARVLSVQNTNAWAKAGVMFRNDLTPGSQQVMVAVTPGKGIVMQYRASANGASTQVAGIAGATPKWVRLVKTDSTYVGQISNDGVAWTEIGRVTVTMPNAPIAGLAVTSHDNGLLGAAVFDDVVVVTGDPCAGCWDY